MKKPEDSDAPVAATTRAPETNSNTPNNTTGGSHSQGDWAAPVWHDRWKKCHPAAELFPLMEGGAFDALVESINKRGLLNPILTLDDNIIDGRNRYRACQAAGVVPRFTEICLPSCDPFQWVWAQNAERRHLTPAQRVVSLEICERESAAWQAERGREKADAEQAERDEENAKRRATRKAKTGGGRNATGVKPRTRSTRKDRARKAKAAGVSEGMVAKAERVKDVATLRQVQSKEKSLDAAVEETKKRERPSRGVSDLSREPGDVVVRVLLPKYIHRVLKEWSDFNGLPIGLLAAECVALGIGPKEEEYDVDDEHCQGTRAREAMGGRLARWFAECEPVGLPASTATGQDPRVVDDIRYCIRNNRWEATVERIVQGMEHMRGLRWGKGKKRNALFERYDNGKKLPPLRIPEAEFRAMVQREIDVTPDGPKRRDNDANAEAD